MIRARRKPPFESGRAIVTGGFGAFASLIDSVCFQHLVMRRRSMIARFRSICPIRPCSRVGMVQNVRDPAR
jgi:hypothetical protein